MDGRMKRKKWRLTMIGCAVLVVSVMLSVRMGSAGLTSRDFLGGLFRKDGYERITFILYHLRIPRTAAAVLAGIGLSASGLAIQNITGNELAGPNIIGINAGAGFFVIMGMYLFPEFTHILPLLAFFGAFLATVLILLIGGAFHQGKSTIILAGVAVTAFLNAGISLISRLDTDLLPLYNDFAVGGLSACKLIDLIVPAIMIAISFLTLFLYSKDIDVLMLGDGISESLGVKVRASKLAVIIASSASAGAVVSFAGLMGFVGLIVPHMARKLFGIRTRTSLLSCAVLGATVVCFADTLGRSVFPGTEIPVGIVMAFMGVPFFLYLIARRRAA